MMDNQFVITIVHSVLQVLSTWMKTAKDLRLSRENMVATTTLTMVTTIMDIMVIIPMDTTDIIITMDTMDITIEADAKLPKLNEFYEKRPSSKVMREALSIARECVFVYFSYTSKEAVFNHLRC